MDPKLSSELFLHRVSSYFPAQCYFLLHNDGRERVMEEGLELNFRSRNGWRKKIAVGTLGRMENRNLASKWEGTGLVPGQSK